MRHALRHFVAEFIGTFAIVFVGSMSLMMANGTGAPASIAMLVVALAVGLVTAVMVTSTMRVAGHLNPAVTLGFMVARRIEAYMAGVYVAGQILGGIAAAFLAKMVVPVALYTSARGGGQLISLDVSLGQAITVELVATFFLVWAVFATAVDPKAPRVGGLAVGFAMTAGILAIGPLTGGSMNPARSLGPALASGYLEGQVVFWTGPLLGGLLAGLLYDQLFLRRNPQPEPLDHGAVDPI
jgi:MIP family channel proteins